jgi:hypothetical protein
MSEIIESDHYKLWIYDGILHAVYKQGAIIGLDTAKEMVAARLKLQNGKIYCCLAHLKDIRAITKEAKKYLAEAGYMGVSKVAIVAGTTMSIQLGNLFILIQKPSKPTRLFKNEEAAIKWLKS